MASLVISSLMTIGKLLKPGTTCTANANELTIKAVLDIARMIGCFM